MEKNTERPGQHPGAAGVSGQEPVRYENGKGCLVLSILLVSVLLMMALAIVLLGDPGTPTGVLGGASGHSAVL
ncbi:MAG: hypothetical protein LAT64_06430 [Phycisphaerales bacterium]|nr:hypothetical protein [Planctomycetota bacterium]MCH8508392.1 hypothetical protein [Phycisphaerales bacterium]